MSWKIFGKRRKGNSDACLIGTVSSQERNIGYTIRVYRCGCTSAEREIVTLQLQTVVMVVVSDIRT